MEIQLDNSVNFKNEEESTTAKVKETVKTGVENIKETTNKVVDGIKDFEHNEFYKKGVAGFASVLNMVKSGVNKFAKTVESYKDGLNEEPESNSIEDEVK